MKIAIEMRKWKAKIESRLVEMTQNGLNVLSERFELGIIQGSILRELHISSHPSSYNLILFKIISEYGHEDKPHRSLLIEVVPPRNNNDKLRLINYDLSMNG